MSAAARYGSEISAVENEVFEGTFLFHSSSAQEVRGIVTCENPHVICETREFHGTEIQIRFQYHADAMFEGMSDQGVFVITSNVGEYFATIQGRYHQTLSVIFYWNN